MGRTYRHHDDDDDATPVQGCPACGNTDHNSALGYLGDTLWLRCRACGWDFKVKENADANA